MDYLHRRRRFERRARALDRAVPKMRPFVLELLVEMREAMWTKPWMTMAWTPDPIPSNFHWNDWSRQLVEFSCRERMFDKLSRMRFG